MSTTTLVKWGTGQGIHVSKRAMESAGVKVGDACVVSSRPGIITLDFSQNAHRRVLCERISRDELFSSWEGSREDAQSSLDDLPAEGAEKELWG